MEIPTLKNPLLIVSLTALAMAASPAFAGQGQGKGHDKGHKGDHGSHAAQYVEPQRGHAPKAHGRHDNGRHLGWQKQAWKRGDRIPLEYLESRYYVSDYRDYRLSAPPRGHRWVRPMDDRYLLIEVATGVIADALGY